MRKRVPLGTLLGVKIEMQRAVLLWSTLLALILGAVAYFWLSLSLIETLIYAVVGVLLHWLTEIFHQMGHAYAARRTGYPMQRLVMFFLLGASVYPRDEPALPAEVHIQRALGGPVFSASASLALLLLMWLLEPAGGLLYYLVAFAFLDNFGVMTVGAFLPLGFTDGSTLLHWWPQRQK